MFSQAARLGRGTAFSSLLRRSISYKAPSRDIRFLMHEVLDARSHYSGLGSEDGADVIDMVVDEMDKFGQNVVGPLYQSGDVEGCTHDKATGDVRVPSGFKEAYDEYSAGGWQGLSVPEEFGGQGLPMSLGLIKAEILGSANWAWSMYPGLTIGAVNTLLLHASAEHKNTYLPKFVDGSWSGTMCLTEPHCGTDLAQLKTKAVPQEDGTYKISGTKIFISCGEHGMTDNIIHVVLARIEGAPEGTRGISLFIVPKFLSEADGTSLASEKNITCGGIEEKMGIHGSSTCTMNFDGSTGYLLGKENKGMHHMFTFMNTARLGTGIQGLAACELALQGALPYARERLAMRSLTGPKFPEKPADPIIVHPAVRTMLLTSKAFAEGGRAMIYSASFIADKMMAGKTEKERGQADEYLGLFTPVVKAFMTEIGYECANHGMTVFGGHGFIREWGMEQVVRDTRISTLYEGTTAVQALDLLGRKVLLGKGATLATYSKEIFGEVKACLSSEHKKELLVPALKTAWATTRLLGLTARAVFAAARNKDAVGAAAVDYLMFSGYTFMAYEWLRMTRVARERLADPSAADDAAFYNAKIATGEFYFERLLPRADGHASTLKASPKKVMQMKESDFDLHI